MWGRRRDSFCSIVFFFVLDICTSDFDICCFWSTSRSSASVRLCRTRLRRHLISRQSEKNLAIFSATRSSSLFSDVASNSFCTPSHAWQPRLLGAFLSCSRGLLISCRALVLLHSQQSSWIPYLHQDVQLLVTFSTVFPAVRFGPWPKTGRLSHFIFKPSGQRLRRAVPVSDASAAVGFSTSSTSRRNWRKIVNEHDDLLSEFFVPRVPFLKMMSTRQFDFQKSLTCIWNRFWFGVLYQRETVASCSQQTCCIRSETGFIAHRVTLLSCQIWSHVLRVYENPPVTLLCQFQVVVDIPVDYRSVTVDPLLHRSPQSDYDRSDRCCRFCCFSQWKLPEYQDQWQRAMNVSWSLLFWLWSILTESNNVNIVFWSRNVSLSISLSDKSSRHLFRYRLEDTVKDKLRRSYFHQEIIIELSSDDICESQNIHIRVMILILLLSDITTRVPINTSVVHRALLWDYYELSPLNSYYSWSEYETHIWSAKDVV